MIRWTVMIFAAFAASLSASAAHAQPDSAASEVASVRVWFVSFERSLDRSKLPFDVAEVADHSERHGGGSPGPDGRIMTTGWARQMKTSDTLAADRGFKLLIKDGDLTTTSGDRPVGEAPWKILCAPRVVVAINQNASITVGQPVSYLDRGDGEGCLTLRKAEEIEGISLDLKLERLGDKNMRFHEIKLKHSRVGSRQPVDGVPLEVGRPIMDSRETSLGLTLERDNVAVIPLPQGNDDPPILVFLTAQTVRMQK